MKHFFAITLATLIAVTSVISSCQCSSSKEGKNDYKPSITGDAGEVLIVLNKQLWESELGTTLREVLGGEYPYLPQREAYFRLYNTSDKDFSGNFTIFRNIVKVNISPDCKENEISIRKDVWARPQCVISIKGESAAQVKTYILENRELLLNTIEQAERDRLIAGYKKYEDPKIREAVTKNIGGSPYFPKGFTIKKNTPDFMWVSQENTYVNQGILIFKVPYTDKSQLDEKNIISQLRDLWQANVPGMRENSYMTFNELIEPGIKNISYKGETMVEVRGLWEVANDFMGGPMICHVFPDLEKKSLIFVNGFVYAPKYDKRKYLRNVESIIFSFFWK